MDYRVFRNPSARTDDGKPRPFGRRQALSGALAERLTAARLVKALLLGVGIGAFALLVAPSL